MALRACLAQRPFVFVLFGMAIDALALGVAVPGRDMARLAGCRGMHTDEREAGDIVFEHDILVPALFVVAPFTVVAELPFVSIVLCVARVTCAFQCHFVHRTTMA